MAVTPSLANGVWGLTAFVLGLFVGPSDGLDFWIPLGFIIGGFLLFLWEVSMPGFFIAIPATVSVVLGIIGLFWDGFFTEPLFVVLIGVLVTAPISIITIRIYRRLAPPDAPPTTTTGESLVGKEGTVITPLDADTTKGKVRIQGVVWSARAQSGSIPLGDKVVVVESRGVHVVVRPKSEQDVPSGLSAPPARSGS